MMNLSNKKVAIALSGGGAKGAYQIGMLRALEEHGLAKENLVLSGTSIGALNALMYAIRDTDAIRDMMFAFGDMIDEAYEWKDDLQNDSDRIRLLLNERMAKLYPTEAIEKNSVPVTVCAYAVNKEEPVYFPLNSLPAEEQRLLTLASASIEGFFPSIEYKDLTLLDGGLIPSVCQNPKPQDKIPVRPLLACEQDLLVISYLKPQDAVSRDLLPEDFPYLEIRPSVPLEEDRSLGGRMDFSKETLRWREDLGYEETSRLLEGQD